MTTYYLLLQIWPRKHTHPSPFQSQIKEDRTAEFQSGGGASDLMTILFQGRGHKKGGGSTSIIWAKKTRWAHHQVVVLHAASQQLMKSNWRNVMVAISSDIAAMTVREIINPSMRKHARSELLKYMMTCYSNNLKARLGTVQSVWSLCRLVDRNLPWWAAAAKWSVMAAVMPINYDSLKQNWFHRVLFVDNIHQKMTTNGRNN